MSNRRIYDAWKYALLAYDEPDRPEDDTILSGAEIYPISNDTDFAFVAIYRKEIVIAFQGTENLKQWLSNMDPYPLEADEYNGQYLKNGDWGKGTIHDGFYESWKLFKNDITELMKAIDFDTTTTSVMVCGHSRGGALAELCSRHLAKNLGIKNSCITFGCPGVGTKAYRDEFRMLPINGTRVVNGWDIVPTVPPRMFGFRKGCPRLIWNKKTWWKKLIPSNRIRDHLTKGYDAFMTKRYNA